MNLDDLLNKAIADNMDEVDLIESLKINNLEFPIKLSQWIVFYENLNHFLVSTNATNEDNPFKNINEIINILIEKKEMEPPEKNILFQYGIYFLASDNDVFKSIEDSKKTSLFSDYLSYRYKKFINAYYASVITAEYSKEQIAEEVWSAFDKGLVKKENIDNALLSFKLNYIDDNQHMFNEFIEGFDKGYIKVKIHEEKNSINHELNDSLSKQNESYNKKRL